MFRLFSKANLSVSEAGLLLLSLLQAHLMARVRHGERLLGSKYSSTIILNWLQKNNRKAGFLYRTKMSAAGDELFLHVVRNTPPDSLPLARVLDLLEDASRNPPPKDGGGYGIVVGGLMNLCTAFVLERGLAS